jgi:hypothetical protein
MVLKSGALTQSVLGSQLDLGNKASAYAEVLVDTGGDSAIERTQFFQALDADLISGGRARVLADLQPLSLNRAYLLAGGKKEYRERYTGAISVLLARDGSWSGRLDALCALSDYYELKLSLLRNGGGRGSEFGNAVLSSLLQLQLSASF